MQKLLIIVFSLILQKTYAQTTDKIEIRKARFRTGDDKSWSLPGIDDSGWKEINSNKNWEDQGFEEYNGFAWYRLHVTLPSSIKESAWWKDSLRINLSRIDDADEIFLNGNLISKNGRFPSDPKGYETQWNKTRDIHIESISPLLRWDKENIIAIRVYDGGGPGGIFGALPYLSMMDMTDAIKLRIETGPTNRLFITNNTERTIRGVMRINVNNPSYRKSLYASTLTVKLLPLTTFSAPFNLKKGEWMEVKASFTEQTTGTAVSLTEVPPYILTPPPSPSPRINGASVFGVRPGSPFLFRIAATGEKPLQFKADKLPAGLALNENTGIITGSIDREGDYPVMLTVTNKRGSIQKGFTIKCGNLLALTPPMGWNSWNCWGLSVSDEKLKSSAQALIDQGLADHGWTYMNIDDGWESSKRNSEGGIGTNSKFQDMRGLGDWLHSRGLKFGIYSSPGPTTCGGYLGSHQHEQQDADTYSRWGVDYLKYDWCSYGDIHGGKDTTLASYIKPYELMRKAIRRQPRDIIYSLCQYGMKDVWKWGHEVDGNLWRTTGDITDSWESLKQIGFRQDNMSAYARPGRWNDPDMLIVGQVGWGEQLHPTRLTPDEQYTHISLWCLLSAPLLIGCDLSRMDEFTRSLLTNAEVIDVDQDVLGRQARRVIENNGYQVWIKELSDGSRAVGVFNLSETFQTIPISASSLKLEGRYRFRDLWKQRDLGYFDEYSAQVPPHGVVLLKMTKL